MGKNNLLCKRGIADVGPSLIVLLVLAWWIHYYVDIYIYISYIAIKTQLAGDDSTWAF